MANRRMFSLDVVDTDKFLELPASSQSLYFHLGMRADDDGFVSAPKKIANMVNCSIDDLKLLMAKKYLIPFDNGVVVITDWKVNNWVRPDRKKATRFSKELSMLTVDNDVYTLATKYQPSDNQITTECHTQVRLGKDSINNKEKGSTSLDMLIAEYTQNEYLRETLKEFLKMRKTIKKAMTDRAFKIMLNKLKGLSEDEDIQIKILEQSIFNSWQGIFPLKDQSEKNTVNHGTSNIEDMF